MSKRCKNKHLSEILTFCVKLQRRPLNAKMYVTDKRKSSICIICTTIFRLRHNNINGNADKNI